MTALAKPAPTETYEAGTLECFDPWSDVIDGISGGYNAECDTLMIAALEAIRDKETLEFMEREGFAGEFMLYVLSGHDLT